MAPTRAMSEMSISCWMHGTVRPFSPALVSQSPQADSRFHSALFQQWLGGCLPVELFAGFAVLEKKAWQQVVLRSRQAIPVADFTVFVPEKAELITIMRRFGRPKDLGRIATLSPSGPSPSRSESA
jgi:hypothetical protein